MANKDLYSILGVSKNASAEELKKAWRKLSLKYHPDKQVGKSDKQKEEASEKMKEINEAYSTLSDENKRQKYDAMGNGGFSGFEDSDFGTSDEFSGFSAFNSFADAFFGRHSHFSWEESEEKGKNLMCEVKLTIDEVLGGYSKQLKYRRKIRCSHCHGTGGHKVKCPYCHGTGYETIIKNDSSWETTKEIHPCSHCGGKGFKMLKNCEYCHSTGLQDEDKIVTVNFKAGINNNQNIVLQGMGNESSNPSAPNGDLIVCPKWDFDFSKYNIDDLPNIHQKIYIMWYDAILGTKKDVYIPGIGKKVLKIPSVTNPYASFEIPDAGFLKVRTTRFDQVDDSARGSYIFDVKYKMPINLNRKEEIELLEKIRNMEKKASAEDL